MTLLNSEFGFDPKIIIETGDILLLHKKKGFLPKAIEWFQKDKYHHAGIFIKINNMLYLAEADRFGTQLTNPDNLFSDIKKYDLLLLKPLYPIDKYKVETNILTNTGTSNYDFTSLLFYQAIKQITGKWIGKTGENAKSKFYCSEFVAYVYSKCDVPYQDAFIEWWSMAPTDIRKLVKSSLFSEHIIS